MSNLRRVNNSLVFVTPVKNSQSNETVTCEKFERICQPRKNSCEFFKDVTIMCESSTSVKDSH